MNTVTQPDLFKTLTLVIDDNLTDLYAIMWGLQSIGLSCVPLQYEAISGLVNADSLKQNLSRARIVFLDLNLDTKPNLGSSDQATHICDVFDTLKLQGPYILIVWSDFKVNMENVLKIAFERIRGSTIPIGIAVLDKEEFLETETKDRNFQISKLGEQIFKIIQNFPQAYALIAWENRVYAASDAVSHVLFNFGLNMDVASLCGELHKIEQQRNISQHKIVQPISCPLYDINKISSVFCAIGKAAYGQHADQHPAGAMDAGLLPMIEDNLLSLPPPQSCDQVWQEFFVDNDIQLSSQEICELNTCLLLDKNKEQISKRGMWIEPKSDDIDKFFQECLGETSSSLRNNFFKESKTNESARIGLLECSAACDNAWKKPLVRLFLLGCLVPEENAKHIPRKDSIFISEKISFEDRNYVIAISFHHICSLKSNILDCDSVMLLFRVRDQLLSQIVARFAAYTSRPGVISIRK